MPDSTVAELAEALRTAEQLATSRSSVQRALTRLGYMRKKEKFVAVERDTPENMERRFVFCALLRAISERRLIFIDESFVKTGMRREYGRSLKGERVIGTRPFKRWKTVSIIGAIRLGQKPKLMTQRGSVKGRVYLHFVRTRLVPWLRRGDIVVMDNLHMHKMDEVKTAIVQAGAVPVYLPTYNPELNPIELLLWGRPKARPSPSRHQHRARATRGRAQLRRRVPTKKIAGWFRHFLAYTQIN